MEQEEDYMPVPMVLVTVLVDGVRHNDVPYFKGDQVEIEDHLVQDWVRLGYAAVGLVALDEPAVPSEKSNPLDPPKGESPTLEEKLIKMSPDELLDIAIDLGIEKEYDTRQETVQAIIAAGYKG
jgi:hypothetical protein